MVKEFTVAAGSTTAVSGTPQDLANYGADPGSRRLRPDRFDGVRLFGATALERASGDTDLTASHTTSGRNGTIGAGAASNMETCGEFRIRTAFTSDTSDPTGSAVDNASTLIAFMRLAAPLLATAPIRRTSLAPGGAATMADAFTFQTSTDTDTITAVVVGLAIGRFGRVELAGNYQRCRHTTVYGSVADPASDTPSITLSTNTLTTTTTSTQYKIRVTPKSHAAMPKKPPDPPLFGHRKNKFRPVRIRRKMAPTRRAITCDDRQPVAGERHRRLRERRGYAQVALTRTNPADADFHSTGVWEHGRGRGHASVEGTTYAVGNTVGTSTVACVVASPTASCTDTGVTNGNSYYYQLLGTISPIARPPGWSRRARRSPPAAPAAIPWPPTGTPPQPGIRLRRPPPEPAPAPEPAQRERGGSTWSGRTRSRCRRAIPPPPVR